MELKKIAIREYERRVSTLEEEIQQKESERNKLEEELKNRKPGKVYAVEETFGGARVSVHRRGDIVKIFNEQGKDITTPFPTIVQQSKDLTSKDFIIDCELTSQNNKLECHVSDILFLSEPIHNEPLFVRKRHLHNLNFTKNIREVPTTIVDTAGEMKAAVKMLSSTKRSIGVIIKDYNAPYTLAGETSTWVEYKLVEKPKVKK